MLANAVTPKPTFDSNARRAETDLVFKAAAAQAFLRHPELLEKADGSRLLSDEQAEALRKDGLVEDVLAGDAARADEFIALLTSGQSEQFGDGYQLFGSAVNDVAKHCRHG